MKDFKTKRKGFRFQETTQNYGIVKEILRLAKLEGRSLNNYVGQVLKKHILEKQNNQNK